MKTNMGVADRIIRLLLAAILVSLYLHGEIAGAWAIVAFFLVAVFIVTGLVKSCPLYLPFGWSTLKKSRHGTTHSTRRHREEQRKRRMII